MSSDPMQMLAPQTVDEIDASRCALPTLTRDVSTVTYEEYSGKLFTIQKTIPHQSGHLLKITAMGSESLFTGAIASTPLRKHKSDVLCAPRRSVARTSTDRSSEE